MMQYYLRPIHHFCCGTCDADVSSEEYSIPKGMKLAHRCGKPLYAPYYLFYPNDHLYSGRCMSVEDEAIQTIKIAEFVKCKFAEHDLDRYDGPGSGTEEGRRAIRDNYTNSRLCSKMRLCQECYYRHKKIDEEINESSLRHHEMLSLERKIYSDHESERCNKPIEPFTSDVERYMISLPDRSYMLEKELGFNVFDEFWRDWSIENSRYLSALLNAIFSTADPDTLADSWATFVSDYVMKIREDIKTNFIKDNDRVFPNDQELTSYMIQNVNDDLQVQYCKIFALGLTKKGNRKFTIIIHYSRPKGYWEDYEIPTVHRIGTSILGCIRSPIWTEYEV